MSARQGERMVGGEPAGSAVGAAGRTAPVPGLLAEPGILVRMLAEATDDGLPVAAGRVPFAPTATFGRFAWLVAAVVWFVLDAAATLGRGGPVGLGGALPSVFALGACGFGLGLVLPTTERRVAAVDLACVLVLLFAAAAGWLGHDALRIGLQAAIVALWIAYRLPARPATGARTVLAVAIAGLAATGVALSRPWVTAVVGPACGQAVSVALLLLLLVPAWRPTDRLPAVRMRACGTLALCTVGLWLVLPATLAADTANAERVLFAAAVGFSLVPLLVGRLAPTILLVVAAALGTAWSSAGAWSGAAAITVLDSASAATATYERAKQTLQLRLADRVVARAGPDHRGAEFACTLVQAFARPGDRVLVLGVGTGRLPDLLVQSGRHEVEVVDERGSGERIGRVLRGDGPVPPVATPAADARVRTLVRPFEAVLAALPAGSRQAIVVAAAPGSAAAVQATIEHQRALRRVTGCGLVLQPFLLDATPVGRVRALLGAAAVAHGWNAVLAIGDDAWLLSAGTAPQWPADAALREWPAEARWIAHAAHIGSGFDLRRALHGTVSTAARAAAVHADEPPPADGATGRRVVLGLLHDLLLPEPLEAVADPNSLLLRWLGQRVNVQLAVDEIERLDDGDEARRRAQAIAVRFLPTGAPAARLQAALGLPAADGAPLVEPSLAIRRAHALDPTLGAALPPVLQSLPRPTAVRGELEDLAVLPPRPRLAELCVGGAPLATALRARFASACARALVELLAVRPLQPTESEALRELADPFVLDEAVPVLQRRGAVAELLPLWRRDLPMPTALAPLLGEPDLLLRLVPALAGRTDSGSLRVLADGLVAPAVELRRAAAVALRATVGDTIAYDPEWPRSALNEAADRVRSLHNRAP